MRKTLAMPLTEAAFTRQVIQYAKLRGWLVAHFRPARTKHGWRTPVSGDGKGFPDLLLLRHDRMIAVELKVGNNYATFEQDRWLIAFRNVIGCSGVWRPCDWPTIERTLA